MAEGYPQPAQYFHPSRRTPESFHANGHEKIYPLTNAHSKRSRITLTQSRCISCTTTLQNPFDIANDNGDETGFTDHVWEIEELLALLD
jgi:hypothetical protein